MVKNIHSRDAWSDKSVTQKGFTLIELLVVIALLGILAVVGVLSFGGLTNNAKKSTAKTELTQVQAAADAYNASHVTGTNNLTDGINPVPVLQTDGELKAGATFQCAYVYTLATQAVSFSGTQTDPNCA